MAKYAHDLDESLVQKVNVMSKSVGLNDMGIVIKAIRLKKSKKSIGEVIQGNDLVKLFTGEENIVAVALYEDAFLAVDEQTQNLWIEGLLSRIYFDENKDKVVINKPELTVDLGMYHKYGNIAVQKQELALITAQQMYELSKQNVENNKKKK